MPFSDPAPYPLTPAEQELLMGASYGSDVTVEELVVTASSGGGENIWIDNYDYYYFTGDYGDAGEVSSWAGTLAAEADAFAAARVDGDTTSPAYQQALEAITALYVTAKLLAGPGGMDGGIFYNAPNGHTMTVSELLQSLDNLRVHITSTPPIGGFDAYTDLNSPPISHVYIDPTKLADDIATFGPTEGVNYTIYHELGHASIDGWADAYHPDREKIANEYGQLLAEIVGAEYPSDAELNAYAGGTVPR